MAPRPTRRLLAAVSLLLLAPTLVACSADDEPAAQQTSTPTVTPEPPALEEAWSVGGRDPRQVVVADDLVVLASDAAVVTVRSDTGEEVSRWTPPRGRTVCQVSDTVGADGVVGVLVQQRGWRTCAGAVALDVRTGTVRWQRVLGSTDPDLAPGERDRYHSVDGIAVTDRTVLVTTFCSEVRRFALDDGRVLDSLVPRDTACRNESAILGDRVAVLDYELGPDDTVDETGTGWIPAESGAGAIALYDADSGRRLWSHLVRDHRYAEVHDVVAVDPVVLTTTIQGRPATRLWSEDGEPGAHVGKTPPSSLFREPSLEVLGRSGDLLVGRYPESADSSVLHAYDLATGAERWTLAPPVPPGGFVTGAAVDGDRLLVSAPVGAATDVLAYDLDEPGEPQLLGRLDGSTLNGMQVAGGLLVVGRAAYRLPAEGESGDYRAPTSREGVEAWADDDVRPEQAVGACEAAGASAPRLLRLGWGDRPAPVDCRWRRDRQPAYRTLGLSVRVDVGEPGVDVTATEAAQELADGARGLVNGEPLDPDETPPPLLPPEATVGEESWGTFSAGGGNSFDGYGAELITRWHNVVVVVEADQSLQIESLAGALTPYGRLQDATYVATLDVLRSLGAEVDLPTRGADGPVARVGEICGELAPVVADLHPELPLESGGLGDEQRTCSWSTGDLGEVVVVVDAVRGGLDGTAATDRAATVAAMLGSGRSGAGRDVAGLPGDVVAVRRYVDRDGTDYLVWSVATVVDNLAVWVEYSDYGGTADRESMEAGLRRLVRTATRAARAG
ncbi:PQQ-like beta-propeller repeat protein [Nocardioides dongxiaopingii]|uniref:PQQ-binding-like beta-propeller repeat protein n=1 Tax=Nocardioides sp. S-1144 TaxID=2582905 RepID=UPI001164C2EC|nr:PQQ-binding-like beta-propeller repeat protein [Nocardioides sp. S-1144]QCW51913.2 PQQ-like beta-propeller repeat protein [Nocardioides sp. S-1144]